MAAEAATDLSATGNAIGGCEWLASERAAAFKFRAANAGFRGGPRCAIASIQAAGYVQALVCKELQESSGIA